MSVYNLVWIRPDFAEREELFRQPIPNETIGNITDIARRNSTTDVRLWIDSSRISESQNKWLRDWASGIECGNFSIRDLREIPEYRDNHLFSTPDISPNWRFDKHSLIWRQVDAARILTCLQGDYDRVFYSDTDITNLTVESDEVQKRIEKFGLILGGAVDDKSGFPWYENQLFGFDNSKKNLFRNLYYATVGDVMKGENGYRAYIRFVNDEIKGRFGIDTREIVFQAQHDGSVAQHPEGRNDIPKDREGFGSSESKE